MKRLFTVMLSIFLLTGFIFPAWADEKKDHICFRALDADQDDRVTLEEFEKHYGSEEAKFKAADADQDGKLTHDEYHDLLGHGASK